MHEFILKSYIFQTPPQSDSFTSCNMKVSDHFRESGVTLIFLLLIVIKAQEMAKLKPIFRVKPIHSVYLQYQYLQYFKC